MAKVERENHLLKLVNVGDENGRTIMIPLDEMGKICVSEHVLEMDDEVWNFDLVMSH